jgi:hypothetical protein
MNYLVFSHTGWADFPYKRLLEILPDRDDVYFIGRIKEEDESRYQVRSFRIADIHTLPPSEFTAIAASPYWIQTIREWQPKWIIALLERCPDNEDPNLWNKFNGLLTAYAQMAITASEKIYLEQCLRKDGVILLHGDRPFSYGLAANPARQILFLQDYEVLFMNAVSDMIRGNPLEQWVKKQWELRERHYRSLNEKIGPHETINYVLASYLYLQSKLSAEPYLAVSFEQMVLKDFTDCLHSHYRFFSAIEAKKGDLERAVHIYSISAFSEGERKRVRRMESWLEKGDDRLVKAEIYRVNEDYRSAIHLLEGVNSPESNKLLVQNYFHAFRWEDALPLLDQSHLSEDNMTFGEVLRGTVQMINNKRHPAVSTFLRASVRDWNALSNIAEMMHLERAAKRLMEGKSDYA